MQKKLIGFGIIFLMLISLPGCFLFGDDSDNDTDATAETYGYDVTGDSGNNGNGTGQSETWFDPQTGLVWQRSHAVGLHFDDAVQYCNKLALDHRTGWQVPTIKQLRSIIANCPDTGRGGKCLVGDHCLNTTCLNDACRGCTFGKSYTPDVLCPDHSSCGGMFWSSSPVTDKNDLVWVVNFNTGAIESSNLHMMFQVRCVFDPKKNQ